MSKNRQSTAWGALAAAAGLAVAVAAWTSGPIGGRGLEGAAEAALGMASVDDPLCRATLAHYAEGASRAAAAFPLPTSVGFAAARDRAGELYVALGCPTGSLLGVMVSMRIASRGTT